MHTLLTTLLLGAVLLSRGQAAEIDNGTPSNWVLGSSGTMDSDFIFTFCPTGSPNCLPSPVTMTSARLHVTAQTGITNVDVDLQIFGPGLNVNFACSGPLLVGPSGADYSCPFPTALTESQHSQGSITFTESFYTFVPQVHYTGSGRQNAQMRLFVQTIDAAPTPEPASLMLIGGALALGIARRRKTA